ncbi:hypothetical protein [Hathewaya limosa]|uniref:Repeat protein (TIGR01451 family) n=1 Tax=Hathewaya limosa TaxID=1536 RepID=A0ABU0JQU7_HATLI|nr:hypothetical protein [Hathewaya limosa]MDQ0479465.1 putative repeat protein (TIGR01451 family) [Hathewaya limosa]
MDLGNKNNKFNIDLANKVITQEDLNFMIIASPISTKIGDLITYVLQITVAKGIIAKNIRLEDTFLNNKQTFIENSILYNGLTIKNQPTPVNGVLTLPVIDTVDATSEVVMVTYSFQVRIIDATLNDKYVDVQKNTCKLIWDNESSATSGIQINKETNIYVNTPNISLMLLQKNLTQNIDYTSQEVNFIGNDVIGYRLSITNRGNCPVYQVLINDTISDSFVVNSNSLMGTKGEGSFEGNNLIWNIPNMETGEIISIDFTVQGGKSVPALGQIQNQVNMSFNSNNNTFGKEFTSLNSNQAVINIQNLKFNVTCSNTNCRIGEKIKYSITLQVYKGTKINEVSIYDILPNSQEYAGEATKQIESNAPENVTPEVTSTGLGQKIKFPSPIINPDNSIDASNNMTSVVYTFSAKIIKGITVTPYLQVQNNQAFIEWISSISGSNEQQTTNIDINVFSPKVEILIEQKNLTVGGAGATYTTNNVVASIGDTIAYKITVFSIGTCEAKNLDIQDVLSDKLSFINNLTTPTVGNVNTPTQQFGGSVQWNIPSINAGNTVSYEFSVKVNSPTSMGDLVSNSLNSQYSSTVDNINLYKLNSNILVFKINALQLEQTTAINTFTVGEEVEYTIKVTIPKGRTVYNLKIVEKLNTNQNFVASSWTSTLGTPGIPNVLNSNNIIEYNEPTSPISSSSTDFIVEYKFKALIIKGNTSSPYVQNQNSICNVTWSNSAGGIMNMPIITSTSITVNSPMLICGKEQRNVTQLQTNFTRLPISNVNVGDEIEYHFYITNIGKAVANNLVIKDKLPDNLQFKNEGDSGVTVVGQEVTINRPFLSETALVNSGVKATVKGGYVKGDSVINNFSVNYQGVTTNGVQLSPIQSNSVGFEYVNPSLTNYVVNDWKGVFAGDTINYKVVITVPRGSVAFNVQVNYLLNGDQEYKSNSLTSVGGVNIPSTTTLTFPNEGTIDATTQEKTITYSFSAKIINVGTVTQSIQQSTATLSWNVNSTGTNGDPQTSIASVYVTPVQLTINKTQSLNNVDFADTVLEVIPTDRIYYKLEINNTFNYPIYNLVLKDITPSNVAIQSLNSVHGTDTFYLDNNNLLGVSNLNLYIPTVSANGIITVVYSAMLKGPNIVGNTTSSLANIGYSLQQDTLNRVYGPINSNEVAIQISQDTIQFYKDYETLEAGIGGYVDYLLKLRVAKGIKLYNAQVIDNLPSKQRYSGYAQLNGNGIMPSYSGPKVTFEEIPELDTSNEIGIFNYSFYSRIMDVINTKPFEEFMTNKASFSWATTAGGTLNTIESQVEVQGRRAVIRSFQLQRNVTYNGVFDVGEIIIKPGDIMEFKIVLENIGSYTAYNIVCKEFLDDSYKFEKTVSISLGNTIYYPLSNRFDWKIERLEVGEIATLIIQISINDGIVAGKSISTQFFTRYFSSDNQVVELPNSQTNILWQKSRNIIIEIKSDKSQFKVDEIITYNILVKVPSGDKFYNLQVQDIIPIGQRFISCSLDGTNIVPTINGQVVNFPVKDSTIRLSNSNDRERLEKSIKLLVDESNLENYVIYNYEVKAKVEVIDSENDQIDIQTNTANISWALDSGNRNTVGPISTGISLMAGENIIELQKFQKIKGSGQFTQNEIEANTGQEIEYKIVVTNIGRVKPSSVQIKDMLSNKMLFNEVVSASQGTVSINDSTSSSGTIEKILTWNGILQLAPNQSSELIYSVKVIETRKEQAINMATSTFNVNTGVSEIEGGISNTVKTNIIGDSYTFIPNRNNYTSDTEAFGYGVVGAKGKIGYIFKNGYGTSEGYNLKIDSIPFSYKLFINGSFIEEIDANKIYDENPMQLNGLIPERSNNIEIIYEIPNTYVIGNGKVDFNVSIQGINKKIIQCELILGTVQLITSYKVNEYPKNPNLFALQYYIEVNISKGIKIYDMELKSYYPPSCIFESARNSSRSIDVIQLNGQIIYPIMKTVDATRGTVQLNYSYTVLQYKKTQLSIGELEENLTILSLRTAKNVQDKCILQSSIFQNINMEKIECLYVDKVFGKCIQYYLYKDITIPEVKGYNFKEVVFNNPEIIENTLSITKSECDENFSKVKYSFVVPYTIIYEQYNCSTVEIKERKGELEPKNLEIILYTPNNKGETYNILCETTVKNIEVNEVKSEFCSCIGIITFSISKNNVVINNLTKNNLSYCCINCDNINS